MSDHHESESEYPLGGCAPRADFSPWRSAWTWLAVVFIGLVSALILQARPKSVCIDDARSRQLGIVLQEIADPKPIVPAEALARDRRGVFVFVQDYERENRFVSSEVTVEPAGEGRVRILHGLFPGDQIVVSGVARLRLEQGIKPSSVSTNCLEPVAETNRHPLQEAK